MDHFLGRNDDKMQCRGILHIVKAGDTLYKIGKEHGVPVSRIMYANPYVDIYNLQIGDEICVPVMTPRTQQTAPAIPMPAVETPARGWQAPPPTPISERYGEDWQETMPLPMQENDAGNLVPGTPGGNWQGSTPMPAAENWQGSTPAAMPGMPGGEQSSAMP